MVTKILVLPPISYKYLYGGILHRTDFCRELASLNYEVFAIGDETVPVNHLHLYRLFDPTLTVHKSLHTYFLLAPFLIIYTIFVLLLINIKNINAVLLFYPPGIRDRLPMILFSKTKFGKKLIVFLIGHVGGEKKLRTRIAFMFDRTILMNADNIVSTSKEITKSFMNKFSINQRKVIHINYGVSRYRSMIHVSQKLARKKLKLPPEPFIAITVTRYTPFRGCEYFLKAAKEVQNRTKNILFIFVGARTGQLYETKIKQNASEMKLKILFFDNVPYNLIPLFLRAANCLVLTSPIDNWCDALREGLANATPIVSFDAGIHRKLPGVLAAKTENHTELANIILKLVQQPKLYEQTAKEAYKTYNESFSLEKEIIKLMSKLNL
ncbi:MAG: glycosyltransferase family 4 protein [Candidatus Bathyarchaeia archaeon]